MLEKSEGSLSICFMTLIFRDASSLLWKSILWLVACLPCETMSVLVVLLLIVLPLLLLGHILSTWLLGDVGIFLLGTSVALPYDDTGTSFTDDMGDVYFFFIISSKKFFHLPLLCRVKPSPLRLFPAAHSGFLLPADVPVISRVCVMVSVCIAYRCTS
jgi:hypothetical protein